MKVQAFLYRGVTYLKLGKKESPGVMYSRQDLEQQRRPAVELWRDGTVTFHDRPEGDISLMHKIPTPEWAYRDPIIPYKSRS